MLGLSRFPSIFKGYFKNMPTTWKSHHLLLFSWLVIMQIISPGKKNLKEQSKWCPNFITEWRFRRLLNASYWDIHSIINWFVNKLLSKLPRPNDGVLYLIADGSKKDKTGKQGPLNQKGKQKTNGSWFFGIKFVLLIACWNGFKFPVSFRLIRKKTDKKYQSENELFRKMIDTFRPPVWVKHIVVLGDCAYASKENIKKIKNKNKSKGGIAWSFVFALSKTWKTEEGKSLKNFVTYLPKSSYEKTWVKGYKNKRRYFWFFSKKANLRHVGEVTMLLSKKGRNVGPKGTKIIVTNLTNSNGARDLIDIYRKRWNIEIVFKELKSGLGLGEHQVTKEVGRVENSVGIAIVAYLFLLLFFNAQVKNYSQESIFKHQSDFKLLAIKNQLQHSLDLGRRKLKRMS